MLFQAMTSLSYAVAFPLAYLDVSRCQVHISLSRNRLSILYFDQRFAQVIICTAKFGGPHVDVSLTSDARRCMWLSKNANESVQHLSL
jgi:hypothetical protein